MGGFPSQVTDRANVSSSDINIVGSFVDRFTPIEKAVIRNQTLPITDTNRLGNTYRAYPG